VKPRVSLRLLMVVPVAGLLLSPSGAVAFPYTVARGDTVAALAERFYGRLDMERVIVAANAFERARGAVLVRGMQIEIPATGYHRVVAGETWKSIASSLLGHADRGDVLSQVNDSHPWRPPESGREILLPYNLRYVAGQSDSTQTVAYRLLGRRNESWVVASYNSIKRARLRPGEVVLVPLTRLELTAAGKIAARLAAVRIAGEAGGQRKQRQKKADAQLPVLLQQVRHGHYLPALAIAAKLLAKEGLSDAQLASVHESLTVAYVALGAKKLAAASCVLWLQYAPSRELNVVDHSPKVRAVCEQVGEVGQGG
jgi:phage tail protein X